MNSIPGLRTFALFLVAALAAGAVARAEGDPPGLPRPAGPGAPGARGSGAGPGLPTPSKKLVCGFLLAKESVSGIGTPVVVTLGAGRRANAVFLGKQEREGGAVVWYFFDIDRRTVIWADESEVEFRGARRSRALKIEAQVGPTCFNTALGNCAAYVSRFGPVGKVNTPSATVLRGLVAEFNQAVAFGADAGAAQDVFALKFLGAHGIGARFAKSDAEFAAHLESGRPALEGLGAVVSDANRTVRFHSGSEIPGITPGGFVQTYVPGNGRAHEVLVLGRLSAPTGRGFMEHFLVIADSKTGEIHVWSEAEVLAARVAETVLVDLD